MSIGHPVGSGNAEGCMRWRLDGCLAPGSLPLVLALTAAGLLFACHSECVSLTVPVTGSLFTTSPHGMMEEGGGGGIRNVPIAETNRLPRVHKAIEQLRNIFHFLE